MPYEKFRNADYFPEMIHRKALASNNRLLHKIASGLLFFFFAILTIVLLSVEFHWMLLLFWLGSSVWFGWSFREARSASNLFYDDKRLYLEKSGRTDTVKLTDIRNVKLTRTWMTILGIHFSVYRIVHRSENGRDSAIKFWVALIENRLHEFEQALKTQNSNVRFDHWAHSFEDW